MTKKDEYIDMLRSMASELSKVNRIAEAQALNNIALIIHSDSGLWCLIHNHPMNEKFGCDDCSVNDRTSCP